MHRPCLSSISLDPQVPWWLWLLSLTKRWLTSLSNSMKRTTILRRGSVLCRSSFCCAKLTHANLRVDVLNVLRQVMFEWSELKPDPNVEVMESGADTLLNNRWRKVEESERLTSAKLEAQSRRFHSTVRCSAALFALPFSVSL